MKKLIPKTEGKSGIDTADGCNENFPCVNGTFSSIVTMDSSRCELKSNVFVHHELLE